MTKQLQPPNSMSHGHTLEDETFLKAISHMHNEHFIQEEATDPLDKNFSEVFQRIF